MNEYMEQCNRFVAAFEETIQQPKRHPSRIYYTGVDLGTACIVLAVLDEQHQPVAGAYRYADVVRDGMIVDYIGAVEIVKELKKELEEKLNTELVYAAASLPPGTDELDGGAIKNVVQSAGFELTNLLDEPTAANQLLQVTEGAVVDIGGGTTGISILENSKVVKIADEATGGTHLSLVIAGSYKVSFQEAETYKREPKHHDELLVTLKPVIEKIASIIVQQTKGYQIPAIYLVGGTACLKNIEQVIQTTTGIKTYKPVNPMFVTPLGIALSCTDQVIG
ncbi:MULTISPECIES: ethanolamine utilization protein EutJ [unclassified Enterococcus]|uniref:ethanolamine utilization protein EutJ n=1 Tax=unclassified Enterococcus TaxID=2608891 RepID=UPI001A915C61|nr:MULTISPECIES: ethanolamine utilization protein EutJ [unclassified Enterococcus]MBO0462654.1 ethanolamine utilization protein EutJ [Enterococcus sp. DIV1298c]MBO1300597.1 ethanolamine utilization protein EutJ [Enterococcus sp. DIV1271a]